MKIGQGSDSSHVGPVGSGKAAGSARASEKSAPAVAGQAPGVPVSVSDLARTLDASQNADPDINLELAEFLERQVWGQGFPQPTFSGQFLVESQRIVGEKHLKLKLRKLNDAPSAPNRHSNLSYDGILFFYSDPLPDRIDAVYRLQIY